MRRLLLRAALLPLVITGCGVPTDDAPRPIPDERVPFGLLDEDTTTTMTTRASAPPSTEPR